MKKRKNLCKLVACVTLAAAVLSGCSGTETHYAIANYQGQAKEGDIVADYNKELFYRNDKKVSGADPFVLDNTARDGYYYAYVTQGSCFVSRSKNMMDWESVGNALNNYLYEDDGSVSEIRKATMTDIWAPEVVYDAETRLYYLFFSATPEADGSVKAGEGTGVEEGTPKYQLMVAVSDHPDGDFELVNFSDADSCGAENVHEIDQTRYPHYFAKYLLFEPGTYSAKVEAQFGVNKGEGYGGYTRGIDPHPYVDKDGQRYLYWVDNGVHDVIYVVKMINWLKPDWDSFTPVATTDYYTIEDYKLSLTGAEVETVSYEDQGSKVNEGPAVVEHNGKYYLTLSYGKYDDSSYRVIQAVGDSPMGPFRKLRSEEGGVLLSGEYAGSLEVSGTGHHSFVTVGEQFLMVYHRHDSYTVMGSARNLAVDEVKWITVKDIDGNDLEVMYVNGPTATEQPKLEAFSDYRNIANQAAVSCSGEEQLELSYLTDGLLSVQKHGNEVALQSIGETLIEKTTTFTFDFEQTHGIRAVMVYNSKMESTAFRSVAQIELVCIEDGKEVVRCIENVSLPTGSVKENDLGGLWYVAPGAAAYAEFEELNVKQVRITLEVPEGQKSVAISEVRILGK